MTEERPIDTPAGKRRIVRPAVAASRCTIWDTYGWQSFWDLTTPEDAAGTLATWYGAAAVGEAADCAAVALADGRDEDVRFWIAVLARLRTI